MDLACRVKCRFCVALLARAWIEICKLLPSGVYLNVALLARAWIEMARGRTIGCLGLVALLARAWIEIRVAPVPPTALRGRSPCESVD